MHTPSQRELRLFGVVARQAADWIERHLAEGALRASEEKYRALFENVDEGVARIELLFDERGQPNDFRWLDYNPAFTRHTGLANVLGKRGREAVPNFDADVLEIYAGVARAGQGIRFERFAPKLERWFSIFVSPVLGDANQLVVIFANVTERKRAEEALRRSEARNAYLVRLGDALRPLGDPGAVKRAAMQVLGEQLAVNRAFYGEFDGDDLLVEHAYESGVPPMPVGGPSKPSPAPWMRATLRAGENVIIADVRTDSRFASELRDGALSIHAIGAVTVPMMKDGRLASSVSVHTDSPRTWAAEEVSLIEETAERTWEAVERARAEAALRESERAARTLLGEATRARADAEAANRAKDEFLATLSHELRTPLAAMLLWARSMRAGGVKPAEISRAVDAIVQSAESQSRLIDDLLDLSRLTAGRIELQRSAVDLRRVVEQAVDTVKPMAAEKSVNLLVSVHREMGSVLLDEQRVKQVLWNLLSNAVKFTPKGGTVRVSATTVEGFIELEVIDDGEGIDAAFLPHVFDKFRQADMADTRRHMGLGIGLTIAKRLTELHGGSIAATSAGLGLGAKFRIRLPWVPAIAPPAPSRPGTLTPLDGLRTLLVEDDTSTLLAMKSSLENAGARVAPFEDGGEALAALERGLDVDVIVSDLGLPRMSGFELIARIGRHYTKDGRPIPP
ncbi:MAG TPA: ATP-binding protein, partial [Polyangiaceae bacterium]|nr:ATP-binding protein [Polyangiaceae bacterium]